MAYREDTGPPRCATLLLALNLHVNRLRLRTLLAALLLLGLTSAASLCSTPAAQSVTTPEQHLGRPLARDFELADWTEVSSYHRKLGQESPRVIVSKVGTTTEGRDFLLTTISSEANLANLEGLREAARMIADPRGLDAAEREQLLQRAKPFVFISLGMHSTETAAPQFGMEFAHRLATSAEEPFKSARENLVILIAPCLNPDGLDHVVSWYRATVGTPFEASGLLKLYQYYAGHDNNRDWFMLSQAETRTVTRLLYSEWFPQVYWDVHQQGGSGERMFVPPFRDPLNPNLDPGIMTGIDQIGTRGLFDMTREGLTGISTGVSYDMWWNGGNRNVPVRHNIVGLLTEAASVDVASPVFHRLTDLRAPRGLNEYAPSMRFPNPWPGGWWRLRDIVDYEHAFGRSLLGSLAREPRLWLENALSAATRAIEEGRTDSPRAWILPPTTPDRFAVRRLVDSLMLGGVEIDVAQQEFKADGRTWAAGSLVIRREQPYGRHVKDLFELQVYPEGDSPYDVSGWTLPLLMGVRRVAIQGELDVPTRRVTDPEDAVVAFPGRFDTPFGDSLDGDSWSEAFRRLKLGETIALETGGDGRIQFEAETPEPDLYASSRLVEGLPRIGLYSPWEGVMNEGWMRYALDSHDVSYTTVRSEMLRAGALHEFLDVLVLPSISSRSIEDGRREGTVPGRFVGGIGPEGAAAVEEFVRAGGSVIAIDRSADWIINLLELPLEDSTAETDFSCPGSVLRVVPEEGELTAGLPGSMAVFFSRGKGWDVPTEAKNDRNGVELPLPEVLLRYAPTQLLLSGWIQAGEALEGSAAWVRAEHGEGAVHLFGFRPQYRGWTQASFPLLFRALLAEASR
ncbi:MAG: hypothetical protein ACI8QS_001270 [Planctomycetota bacterium]